MSEPLSRDEFITHVGLIRDDVRRLDTKMEEKLDGQDERIRKAETGLAVLRDRGTRSGAAAGGLAGAVLVVLELLRHYVMGVGR